MAAGRPGWLVVEYSAAPFPGNRAGKGPATFYLVSPSGRRYPFYRTVGTTFPALQLIDWSGDGQRILAAVDGSSEQRDIVLQISLATGALISRFSLPAGVIEDQYTRPHGDSVLAFSLGTGIFVYDLQGHRQRVLARGQELTAPLSSPDGPSVVAGTATGGLDVISSNGAVTRRIAIPGARYCQAVRWWTAAVVLASCDGRAPSATSRLWLVPTREGRPPSPLTPALRPHGLFLGYVGGWRLPGGLFLLADDAHDTLSIVRQSRDGSRRTVTVPGSADVSDLILGAHAGRMLLQSNVGGPGGPSSLFWFNPATGSIRYLFRTPPGVYGAVPVRTLLRRPMPAMSSSGPKIANGPAMKTKRKGGRQRTSATIAPRSKPGWYFSPCPAARRRNVSQRAPKAEVMAIPVGQSPNQPNVPGEPVFRGPSQQLA